MITSEVSSVVYNGTGSTGPFPVPFPFPANADLDVELRVGTGGPLTLTEGTDYTLTGSGYFTSGGSLTLTIALAEGSTLTITRTLALTQPSRFRDLGAFFPQIHEQAFDRLCMLIQQQQAQIDAITARIDALPVMVVTGSGGALVPNGIDTSLGDVAVDLASGVLVCLVNTGSAGYSMIVSPSVVGQTIMRQDSVSFEGYDEPVILALIGTDWVKLN